MAKFNVSTERTIWCGRCVVWEQDSAPRLKPFLDMKKREGWTLVNGVTLCPLCAAEVRKGRAWDDIGFRP